MPACASHRSAKFWLPGEGAARGLEAEQPVEVPDVAASSLRDVPTTAPRWPSATSGPWCRRASRLAQRRTGWSFAGGSSTTTGPAPQFGTGWLTQLNGRYQTHWTAKQERIAAEERRRLQEERKRVVVAQRHAAYERAKKMGYRVREAREGETIRLVLVKRTY